MFTKISKRRVGVYRPVVFKPNLFIVFRTGNIESYIGYVSKEYHKLHEDGIPELMGIFGINCNPPLIMCSPKTFDTYTDLKLGYHDLLNKIESDNNIVLVTKPRPKDVSFAIVELSEDNSHHEYLENALADL